MERMRDLLELVAGAQPAPASGLAPALAWTLAAGPALAAQTRCRGLEQGVFKVGVLASGAVAETVQRQIESVAPELRRALNRMLGAGSAAPTPEPVQRLQFSREDPS